MKKYFSFVFFIFIIFIIPAISFAQVMINEIMYDLSGTDSGREWIEIYNLGTTPMDISGWKFLESTNASNHGLTLISGTGNISSLGFAVISNNTDKFILDQPTFSGNLFKASFSSLNNTNGTILIKDIEGNIINQMSYDSSLGASGDGNSLQRQADNTWIPTIPTPGTSNSSVISNNNLLPKETIVDENATTPDEKVIISNNSSAQVSSHYSAPSLVSVESGSKLEVGAGRNRLATVGTPIEFRAETNTEYTKNITFEWSFGDGSTAFGKTLTHTYYYPGEYVVVLNISSSKEIAISRTNVKIIPAELSITSAKTDEIEITNNSKNEVNLFGRALFSKNKIFLFPKDTIIKAGQKIDFDSNITKLYPNNIHDVDLIITRGLNKDLLINETKNIRDNINKQISLIYEKTHDIEKQLAIQNDKNTENNQITSLNISNKSDVGIEKNTDEKISMEKTQTASVVNAIKETEKKSIWKNFVDSIKEFFIGN